MTHTRYNEAICKQLTVVRIWTVLNPWLRISVAKDVFERLRVTNNPSSQGDSLWWLKSIVWDKMMFTCTHTMNSTPDTIAILRQTATAVATIQKQMTGRLQLPSNPFQTLEQFARAEACISMASSIYRSPQVSLAASHIWRQSDGRSLFPDSI